MQLDTVGIEFLKAREGLRLKSYNDGAKWTIGYGNTYYEDGTPVQANQVITASRAEKLFKIILAEYESDVTKLVGKAKINQNQFNALVSYAYNRGSYRFANTTLLDLVIANPNDAKIKNQFALEWGTNTQYKTALIARRKLEANLYFTTPTGTSKASTGIFIAIALGLLFGISNN